MDDKDIDLSDINFSLAYNALDDHPHSNIFITGGAGTGKSLILSSYYHRLIKHKKNVVVISPTGVSAQILHEKGIPAVTIHSFFQLKPHPIFEQKINMSGYKKKIISNLDFIMIDEISMVSPALFDHIAWILNELGFKGRVVFFGDPLQLSPVVKFEDRAVYDYYIAREYIKKPGDVPQFYSGVYFKQLRPEIFALTTIYRQENLEFASVLSRIRKGDETDEDLSYINKRVIRSRDFYKDHKNALYLATTNERVDFMNRMYASRFTGSACMTFVSESEGTLKKDPEEEITIYKGEQVMCIHNNNEEGYQNGTLGIVEDFDKESVLVNTAEGMKKVQFETWFDYKITFDKKTHTVETEECGKCRKIGCKPTFASTVHKAQGLTLDAIYVDLSRNFIPTAGVYLALSRVKTIEGLGISRPITRRDIKVDENVKAFYRGLATASNASLLSASEYESGESST